MSAGLCGHARIDVIYITLSLFSGCEQDRITLPSKNPTPASIAHLCPECTSTVSFLSGAEAQLLVIAITSHCH